MCRSSTEEPSGFVGGVDSDSQVSSFSIFSPYCVTPTVASLHLPCLDRHRCGWQCEEC